MQSHSLGKCDVTIGKIQSYFEVNFCRFNIDRFFQSARWSWIVVGVKIGQKQGVDKSRFPQTGLPHHHQCEFETTFDRLSVNLGKIRKKINFEYVFPNVSITYTY